MNAELKMFHKMNRATGQQGKLPLSNPATGHEQGNLRALYVLIYQPSISIALLPLGIV
jgi:hypothetical protein